MLGSRLDQDNWEKRFDLEQKRTMLEKRISATERLVIVLNKAPIMRGLQASLDAEKRYAEMAMACVMNPPKVAARKADCERLSRRSPERIESLGKEIHALGSEYAAAVTLAATYFGPETRKAAEALNRSGWWPESANPKPLLDAMGRELSEFPK